MSLWWVANLVVGWLFIGVTVMGLNWFFTVYESAVFPTLAGMGMSQTAAEVLDVINWYMDWAPWILGILSIIWFVIVLAHRG